MAIVSELSQVENTVLAAVEIVKQSGLSEMPEPQSIMTVAEARQCVEAIKQCAVSLRQLLVELYDRRGWEVLGYTSITACLVAEFQNSKPVLVRELKVGRIEKEHLQVPIGTYRESQLRPLSKLSSPQQYREAMAKAHQVAGDNKLTANHVDAAVSELNASKLAQIKLVTPQQLPYRYGDIVIINCDRTVKEAYAKYNNCWGIVADVLTYGCTVQIMGQEWNIHWNDLKEIDLVDKTLEQVAERVVTLLKRSDLDEMEREILERYHRRQWFTPWQLQLLQTLENLRTGQNYGTNE